MKQRFIFILLSVLLFRHSISEFDCSSMAERMPAGLSCQKIFTENFLIESRPSELDIQIPTIAKLTHFFDQLEKYGENGTRASYEKFMSFKYQVEVGHPAIQLGKELYRRDLLGDENTRILKNLGFITVNQMIVPPRRLEIIYLNLYKQIFQTAEKFKIPHNELVLPAIVFQSRSEPQKLLFVRPGIDPLPDPNSWTLPSELKDFERHLFAEMILQRRFIIEPMMLPHDIGHLVDFIKHPAYHQVYFQYIEARTNYDLHLKKAFHRYTFNAFEKYLDQIINEWIYLPHQNNLKLIRKLIPNFQFKQLSTRDQISEKYRQIPKEQLKKLAENLLKNQFLIFSSHGGGTHDTSYVKFRNQAIGFDAFMDLAHNSANDVYWLKHRPDLPPATFDESESIDRYLKYQAPAIFERLQMLLEPQPSNYLNGILRRTAESKNRENDLEFAQIELIIAHLTEIEQRLQDGFYYQLTPEQIVRDFQIIYQKNGLKKFKETQTARYFSNFPRGSAPRFLFFDLMDLDTHSESSP